MSDEKTDFMVLRLTKDLRQAARIMAELGNFETGQAIMNDAADEIERLRAALARLQLPFAFHDTSKQTPEHEARMLYANSILNGKSPKEAEQLACDYVKDKI